MGLLHSRVNLTQSCCIHNRLELNTSSRIFVWIFVSLVCIFIFFFLMCVLPLSNVGIKVMLTSYEGLRKLCFPLSFFIFLKRLYRIGVNSLNVWQNSLVISTELWIFFIRSFKSNYLLIIWNYYDYLFHFEWVSVICAF